MPIFNILKSKLTPVEQDNFSSEKELQNLIERNIETVFNCQLIASEFTTGAEHAGRIDTLALSEDHHPVIIEYKKTESSDLINQSLFYLSWLGDHRGDFEIEAKKKIGNDIKVDWSTIRVIGIAPNNKKYDLHAVHVMGANIELWKYRLYKNSSIYLEEVFQQGYSAVNDHKANFRSIASKRLIQKKLDIRYTFSQHINTKSKSIRGLAYNIQEYMMGLDPSMEEAPKKFYIAYKISQNIVCMEIQKLKILLFVKINPKSISKPPPFLRDVSNIGHYGTGNTEITIKTEKDFELVKSIIKMAYNKIGG